ncbi:MAG: hypothetical protein HY942_03645 [Gammaproteobacteria bacterium]|nr:hypothetical protein [Gammaproteobacteria bacterium]
MRAWLVLLSMLVTLAGSAHAGREAFFPHLYQDTDGAITVYAQGDFVDPYFATKALLAADAAGLDVHAAAGAWIGWLLPRQLPDGRFERYCRIDSEWTACREADADDAMLALWLELLHTMAPWHGLPPEWEASRARAEQHLAGLRDERLGVYVISHSDPVALLMDNTEIYGALRVVARRLMLAGQWNASRRVSARADDLERAIVGVFWDDAAGGFRISTQLSETNEFYPDVVAQLYPAMSGMPAPTAPAEAWRQWRERHASSWVTLEVDEFPWGLVALTAYRHGDADIAQEWLGRAEPLRNTPRWNILEEAVFQGLAYRIDPPVISETEFSAGSLDA